MAADTVLFLKNQRADPESRRHAGNKAKSAFNNVGLMTFSVSIYFATEIGEPLGSLEASPHTSS